MDSNKELLKILERQGQIQSIIEIFGIARAGDIKRLGLIEASYKYAEERK